MKFNEFMKSARELRKLTQEKAGELIGVSTNTIQNWEKNCLPREEEVILKIIEVYDLDLSQFKEIYIDTLIPKPKNTKSSPYFDILPQEYEVQLKELKLTELELELICMQNIYYGDGYYGSIKSFPYEYIKNIGLINLYSLEKNLNYKLRTIGLKEYIISQIISHPKRIFDINDITKEDFINLLKNMKQDFREDKLFDILFKIYQNLIFVKKGLDKKEFKYIYNENYFIKEYLQIDSSALNTYTLLNDEKIITLNKEQVKITEKGEKLIEFFQNLTEKDFRNF